MEVENEIKELKSNNTITLTNNIFVKEKSKHSTLIDQREIIWNCSNGVNNILIFIMR